MRQKIKGVGLAKSTLILAAFEFAQRRIKPEGWRISFPADVLPLITHFADRKKEYLICISLNGAQEVITSRVVSVGRVNVNQVYPREVFADPIVDRAAAVILAQNRPAGGVEPGREDFELARRLKIAGEILGVKVLDYVIFDRKGYYSFLERGEI